MNTERWIDEVKVSANGVVWEEGCGGKENRRITGRHDDTK